MEAATCTSDDTTCRSEERISDDDPPTSQTRRSYTVQKKLQVIEKYHELGQNISGAAKECGVPRGCIQEWVQ